METATKGVNGPPPNPSSESTVSSKNSKVNRRNKRPRGVARRTTSTEEHPPTTSSLGVTVATVVIAAVAAWVLLAPGGGRPETLEGQLSLARTMTAALDRKSMVEPILFGEGLGLGAKDQIRRGETVLTIHERRMITSKSAAALDPGLGSQIAQALASYDPASAPTVGVMLAAVHLALEAAKGGSSRHAAYVHTLPRNVSSIGEYWTEDESRCALDWASAAEYQQKLHAFRGAGKTLLRSSPLLAEAAVSLELLEWAYVMVRTRALSHPFDQDVHMLVPGMDMVNHDALRGHGVTHVVTNHPRSGSAPYDEVVVVSSQDYEPGKQIWNSYSSTMSAQELARKYGYAESHPTLYAVPQIGQLLARSELNEMEAFRRACTGGDHLFYGDGGETIGHGTSFTVNAISLAGEDSKDHAPIEYHPTRPSVMVVQCIKDSLGTTDARDVAQFVHEALGQQLAQYREIAAAAQCQTDDGNMPMVRQLNRAVTRQLEAAMEAASDGVDGAPYVSLDVPDLRGQPGKVIKRKRKKKKQQQNKAAAK